MVLTFKHSVFIFGKDRLKGDFIKKKVESFIKNNYYEYNDLTVFVHKLIFFTYVKIYVDVDYEEATGGECK